MREQVTPEVRTPAAPAWWTRAWEGVRAGVEWFGELTLFGGRLLRATFKPPYEWREFVRQMDEVGSKSVFLVMLAGAATGVVLSLETRDSLVRFGAKSALPALIVFSILKETGPIITSLVVSGRVGAGIGAEVGSMKVTEQIDAIEALGVDPFKYLVATRVWACVLMLPLLSVVCEACGILMGWVASAAAEPMALQRFLDLGFQRMAFSDFLPSLLKTMVFGWIIGVVACFQGMRASRGTRGVGIAATSSVVLSSLFIILADVVLVRFILFLFPRS